MHQLFILKFSNFNVCAQASPTSLSNSHIILRNWLGYISLLYNSIEFYVWHLKHTSNNHWNDWDEAKSLALWRNIGCFKNMWVDSRIDIFFYQTSILQYCIILDTNSSTIKIRTSF